MKIVICKRLIADSYVVTMKVNIEKIYEINACNLRNSNDRANFDYCGPVCDVSSACSSNFNSASACYPVLFDCVFCSSTMFFTSIFISQNLVQIESYCAYYKFKYVACNLLIDNLCMHVSLMPNQRCTNKFFK